MAANINPVFALTPNRGRCRLTTGNVTRDLSSLTDASLLFTAGANGSIVSSIVATHVAATSTQASIACVLGIYICSNVAGANPRLIKEVALPAITPSVSAVGQTQQVIPGPIEALATGESLWARISVTQTSGAYDIVCNGGDL